MGEMHFHLTHNYTGRAGRCHRCGCLRSEGTQAYCEEILPIAPGEETEAQRRTRQMRDAAWKEGYEACKRGAQMHSPYRDPVGEPQVDLEQAHAEGRLIVNHFGDEPRYYLKDPVTGKLSSLTREEGQTRERHQAPDAWKRTD